MGWVVVHHHFSEFFAMASSVKLLAVSMKESISMESSASSSDEDDLEPSERSDSTGSPPCSGRSFHERQRSNELNQSLV